MKISVINGNKLNPKQKPTFINNYVDAKNITNVNGCIIHITNDKTNPSFKFNIDHCYIEASPNQKTAMFTVNDNPRHSDINGVDLSGYAIIPLEEWKRLKNMANEDIPHGI